MSPSSNLQMVMLGLSMLPSGRILVVKFKVLVFVTDSDSRPWLLICAPAHNHPIYQEWGWQLQGTMVIRAELS